MHDLVSQEEFVKSVKQIEGVDIALHLPYGAMVKPYTFNRIPDDATVDDLSARINKCLPPFQFLLIDGDIIDLKENEGE